MLISLASVTVRAAMPRALVCASFVSLCVGTSLLSAENQVFADFEGSSYSPWTVEGNAFGAGPAHGSVSGQMSVTGFEGRGLANSFNHGDASTGSLTSPEFELRHHYIRFLIGGGGFEGACQISFGSRPVCFTTGFPSYSVQVRPRSKL